jgi:hypothetical protein
MGMALIWNALYIWMAFEFVCDARRSTHSSYGMVHLLVDLFYAFGITMHMSIFTINWVIILKEMRIEFLDEMRVFYDGQNTVPYPLGFSDLTVALEEAFNLINPFWWFNRLVHGSRDEKAELDAYIDSLSDE